MKHGFTSRSFHWRFLRLALVSSVILAGGLVFSDTPALAAGGEPTIDSVLAFGITEHIAANTGGDRHWSSSCIPPAFNLSARRPSPPEELSTPLEATILSSFAIFRRPALPSDAPPGLNLQASGLGRELDKDYELASYYPAYVRQVARLPDGRRYFVIPAFGRPETVPPAHCYGAGIRREMVKQERRRLVEPVYCIIENGDNGSAPVPGCEPFAQIDESSRAFHVSDFLGGEPTIELVPDGIASVRIVYRATAPIVADVSENAFLLIPPTAPRSRLDSELKKLVGRLVGGHLTKTQRITITTEYNRAYVNTYPTRIEWLNSAGEPVRALSPPTAESESATSVGDLGAPIEVSVSLGG